MGLVQISASLLHKQFAHPRHSVTQPHLTPEVAQADVLDFHHCEHRLEIDHMGTVIYPAVETDELETIIGPRDPMSHPFLLMRPLVRLAPDPKNVAALVCAND